MKSYFRTFKALGALTRAFTLIEILIALGVISILAGVGTYTVMEAKESARVAKLEKDVATLNEAVQIYLSSGGKLDAGTSPNEVLTILKKKADAESAAKLAGFRGSFADMRLQARMQTSSQSSSGEKRAIWNASNQRFEVVTTGAGGVHEFLLDDVVGEADYGSEARTVSNPRGEEDGWIWNYGDVAASTPTGPERPLTDVAAATNPPDRPSAQVLSAPVFSPPQGDYLLTQFDLGVTLTDPNSPGTAQIWVNTGAGFKRYGGDTLSVEPGQTLSAMAKTIDPDHWLDSNAVAATWEVIPFQPEIEVVPPKSSFTYAEAGGAMMGQTPVVPAKATLQVTNFSSIPEKYRSSTNFKTLYTVDGTHPLTGGTEGPAFTTAYVSPEIDVSLAQWGSASSLMISAAMKALNTTLFADSSVASASISIQPLALAAPVIDPPSGVKAVDLPVSVNLAEEAAYPENARIYYTTDGTDPGNANGNPVSGTLYEGQFNAGAGVNGVVTVKARVYGPSGFGQWFTPSPVSTQLYTTITLAEGALVGSATLNGTFVGSLVYAPQPNGTMSDITFNGNARILKGNLYVPGQPKVKRTNGTIWDTSKDGQFSDIILGWEFDAAGERTQQTTPRVLDENGSIYPNNYSITFNNSALLEGKVIRRHDAPVFPVIAAPPPPDSNGSLSLDNPPPGPISASQYASININTNRVGEVRLEPGNYRSLKANNQTAFVLGDPDHPEITQYYSIQGLDLNSSSQLKIVGKVILTISSNVNLNSGSVLGNAEHPEWLQLQFYNGNLQANSGSYAYAQLVAPAGSVTFNAGSIFEGSVTASSLTINSNGVVFSLPPVIQN